MDKFVSKIKFRRDTSANLANIVLELGEPAISTDTGLLKIGNGEDVFAELPAISATHIIEEPVNNGEYLRKKEGDTYTWVLKDARKDLKDLLQTEYSVEVDMGYTIKDPASIDREVYGIRKYFSPITIAHDVKLTKDLEIDNVENIIAFGGTFTDGHDHKIALGSNFNFDENDKASSCLYIKKDTLTNTNKLYIDSICSSDRVDTIIDVWVLYTKAE